MENNAPSVPVAELRSIINAIFDSIQERYGVDEIQLERDLYWEVSPDDLFDPTVESVRCALGSLFDDWKFISGIANNKEAAIPQMLMHVAPLLAYIARTSKPPK